MTTPHPPAGTPPDQTPPHPQHAWHLIGERLRAARLAAHLTQQELAGTTYSKSYISAVEHGKMTPSLQALHRLAERLGRPISYFFEGDTSAPAIEAPEAPARNDQQEALLSEAERLLQEGRYEEALALFVQAGQLDRARWAHERYAEFLGTQGRYQEAYEQMRLVFQGRRG